MLKTTFINVKATCSTLSGPMLHLTVITFHSKQTISSYQCSEIQHRHQRPALLSTHQLIWLYWSSLVWDIVALNTAFTQTEYHRFHTFFFIVFLCFYLAISSVCFTRFIHSLFSCMLLIPLHLILPHKVFIIFHLPAQLPKSSHH